MTGNIIFLFELLIICLKFSALNKSFFWDLTNILFNVQF